MKYSNVSKTQQVVSYLFNYSKILFQYFTAKQQAKTFKGNVILSCDNNGRKIVKKKQKKTIKSYDKQTLKMVVRCLIKWPSSNLIVDCQSFNAFFVSQEKSGILQCLRHRL